MWIQSTQNLASSELRCLREKSSKTTWQQQRVKVNQDGPYKSNGPADALYNCGDSERIRDEHGNANELSKSTEQKQARQQ